MQLQRIDHWNQASLPQNGKSLFFFSALYLLFLSALKSWAWVKVRALARRGRHKSKPVFFVLHFHQDAVDTVIALIFLLGGVEESAEWSTLTSAESLLSLF